MQKHVVKLKEVYGCDAGSRWLPASHPYTSFRVIIRCGRDEWGDNLVIGSY
ncbi:hypothetical protein KSC_074790 [Ktedonobacter sp. SOSP1-52]|nr:hypothetical protein KSC_074790 [Ktedonobacter sp. SOSP1-52]